MGGPTVWYTNYCADKDNAALRDFIINCTKANQVQASNTHSPEDVVIACKNAGLQSCPSRWVVGPSGTAVYYATTVPCDKTGNPEWIEACRKAGWQRMVPIRISHGVTTWAPEPEKRP
jgi:hypothetical protein